MEKRIASDMEIASVQVLAQRSTRGQISEACKLNGLLTILGTCVPFPLLKTAYKWAGEAGTVLGTVPSVPHPAPPPLDAPCRHSSNVAGVYVIEAYRLPFECSIQFTTNTHQHHDFRDIDEATACNCAKKRV